MWRRGLRGGFFLLFDLDFLLQRVLQVGGGLLELVEAATEGLAQFRQFPGPENNERDHQDDDQLRHADGTKHNSSLLPPRTQSPRRGDPGFAVGTAFFRPKTSRY